MSDNEINITNQELDEWTELLSETVGASLVIQGILDILNSPIDLKAYPDSHIHELVNGGDPKPTYGDFIFTIKYWLQQRNVLHYEQQTKILQLCQRLKISPRRKASLTTTFDQSSIFYHCSIMNYLLFLFPGCFCFALFGNNDERFATTYRESVLTCIEETSSMLATDEDKKNFIASCLLSSVDCLVPCINDQMSANIVERCSMLFHRYLIPFDLPIRMKRDEDGQWAVISFESWKRVRYIADARLKLRNYLREPFLVYQTETPEAVKLRRKSIAATLLLNLLHWHLVTPVDTGIISEEDLKSDLHLISQIIWKEHLHVFTQLNVSFIYLLNPASANSSSSTSSVTEHYPQVLSLAKFFFLWIQKEERARFRSILWMFLGKLAKMTLVEHAVHTTNQKFILDFPPDFVNVFITEMEKCQMDFAQITEFETYLLYRDELVHMHPDYQGCQFFQDVRHSETMHLAMNRLMRTLYNRVYPQHLIFLRHSGLNSFRVGNNSNSSNMTM